MPTHVVFALDGARPNPSVGDLMVSFSLPSAEPARLEMFDLAGRLVLAQEVGSVGAGTQRLNLSRGVHLSAGVYLLRLTQGAHRAFARTVVIR